MAKIVVTDRDGQQHEVEGRVGLKVMETLRELDYGVLAICGGLCSCATCHVHVDGGWVDKLPPQEGDEKELLMELSHYDPARSRLSCQLEFTADLDGLALTIAPDE
jgi:2Fe-2S ferredoxin